MTYDAISAYTVLFGDGDDAARVSVHGTAEEAWRALDDLVRGDQGPHGHLGHHPTHRPRRSGWRRGGRDVPRAVDAGAVREAAERWRCADPGRRYWQVSPHRLQVTVPAIARA